MCTNTQFSILGLFNLTTDWKSPKTNLSTYCKNSIPSIRRFLSIKNWTEITTLSETTNRNGCLPNKMIYRAFCSIKCKICFKKVLSISIVAIQEETNGVEI